VQLPPATRPGVAAAQHACSLLHACKRRLLVHTVVAASLTASVTDTSASRCLALRRSFALRPQNTSRESAAVSDAELDPMRVFSIGRMSGKGRSRTSRKICSASSAGCCFPSTGSKRVVHGTGPQNAASVGQQQRAPCSTLTGAWSRTEVIVVAFLVSADRAASRNGRWNADRPVGMHRGETNELGA
jgi:hypothetical protein